MTDPEPCEHGWRLEYETETSVIPCAVICHLCGEARSVQDMLATAWENGYWVLADRSNEAKGA